MIGRTAKMQKMIMMVMAVDEASIGSDDNFHNDDSIMTVEAVMMIPTSCVHVTGVNHMSKSSEVRHNNAQINNKQGCGGREQSNLIT